MSGLHSRALALAQFNHADRPQNLQYANTVPAGTGITTVLTYTVGTNIQARIEHIFIRLNSTTSFGQAFASINARGITLAQRFSPTSGVETFIIGTDVLLKQGDTIQLQISNSDVAGKFIQITIFVREVDL